tara:strand:+ start:756 stop:1253 length:498 start_codon:yes stop_codon:yes gene_type:complete
MNFFKGIIFLTSILVLSRIIPHPPNFTPILAGIIFLPFIKKDLTFALMVPLVSMIISDLVIGMHGLMLWTYGSLMVLSLISFFFYQDNFKRVGTLALISPMIFFILSNFGVWMNSKTYSPDMEGLIACYINAIPFYTSSALACILFASIFYLIKISFTKKLIQDL